MAQTAARQGHRRRGTAALRNFETGLEIDDLLNFRDLLYRQVGGLLAFEYAPGIDADLAVGFCKAASIAHQAAGSGEISILKDRRHRVTNGQSSELLGPADKGRRSRLYPGVSSSHAAAPMAPATSSGSSGSASSNSSHGIEPRGGMPARRHIRWSAAGSGRGRSALPDPVRAHCLPCRMPEKAMTLRLPIPAETWPGRACANAFITVSAT